MKLFLPGIPSTRGTEFISADGIAAAPTSAPNVSRFLHVEVKHHHEVPSRSRTGLSALTPVTVEANADDVVELEFEGGIKQWISVEQLRLDMAAAGVRSAEDGVRVPMQPLGVRPGRERGVTEWVLKGLKVLGISPVDTAADWAEGKVIAKFEAELRPAPGLHRLESPMVEIGKIERAEDFGDAALPALIFIHGTASSIAGSFSAMTEDPKVWGALRKKYGRQIFGFQHPTLSVSPVANALALAQVMPAGARLHLVSHSRGGLVGELLCLTDLTAAQLAAFQRKADAQDRKAEGGEVAARQAARAAEIAALQALVVELKRKQFKIERFVRVACPARGTILASGRLDLYLSLFTSVLGHLVGKVPGLEPIYEFAQAVVIEVARRRTRPEGLPGLEAQMPESPLIHLLNNTGLGSEADLAVIAGDIERGSLTDSFGKWLGVLATDLFYWEDHDLVVNTSAMDGGITRGKGMWRFFDQGAGVSHFNYFHNPRTRDVLVAWLDHLPDAEAKTGFEQRARSVPTAASVTGTRSTAEMPVVFVLPGIMGTLLGDGAKSTLWLDQQRLAVGGLRQLDFKAAGIVPLGLIQENYGALAEHLSRENEVVLFGYDWRLSVMDAGARLATAVEEQVKAGRVVRLLAHSMGGLVARAMIAAKPKLWDQVCAAGGRLVQLGTPNRGSYAIPRVLWGVDSAARMLAMINPQPLDELCSIFAGWPGLLEMLPDEEPANGSSRGRFFDAGWWREKRPGAAPAKASLTAAAKVRQQLDKADLKQTIYVAGLAAETPDGLTFIATGSPIWSAGPGGDGTVTHALGNLAGSDVYYVEALHGDLANHPPAFDALSELLTKGATSKLPTTFTAGSRSTTRDGLLRDDAPLLFPSQEDLLAAALRTRPRRRTGRQQTLPAIQVTVCHGDLRLAKFPVVVGHYAGDSIVSAERVLDEQLGRRLSERARFNLYPGRPGTVEIVLDPKASPPGAIVAGLGEVGEITAEKVRGAVTEATLRYLLRRSDIARTGAEAPSAGLSFLLIGTNGGNALRIGESVRAIVRGVLEAHHTLLGGDRPPEELLGEIQIVELYESTAARALHALRQLDPQHPAGFEGAQSIEAVQFLKDLGSGRFQPPLSEYEGGWWRRILVMRERDEITNQPKRGMKFTILTDRARVEDRMVMTQEAFIRSFQEQGTRSTEFRPEHARMLFDLLVPDALKERMRTDGEPLVIIVDPDTAQYPWEMLARRSAQGLEMLATRFGMLRQFRTPSFEAPPPRSRQLKAVVIGDPVSNFPELPGAQDEARLVAGLLEASRYRCTPLIRPNALEALTQLFDPDCRVLHVAAHGDYDAAQPDNSGIVLGTGQFFTTSEVSQLPVLPELVFINCCHLAHIDEPRLLSKEPAKFAASIAQRFIERGVKAIVAAGWAVDDGAAKTFARTFYREMLAGERFGNAILAARQAAWREHPGINTWAAYQAYGDPEFRLELGTNATAAAGVRPPPERVEFCSRSEFLFELRGLAGEASKSDKTGAKPEELIPKIEAVAAALPPGWRDGEMLTALADAWAAVGRIDEAINGYEDAFRHGDGKAPLRAIEQFINKLDRDMALKLGALPKRVRSEERRPLEDRRQIALDFLSRLLALGETSERLALLGGFHKRSARLATNRRLAQSHLKKAFDAYDRAWELVKIETGSAGLYPAHARLTFGYLSGAMSKAELLAEADRLVAVAREQARASVVFWDRIGLPDLLVVRHLISGDLDAQLETILAAYQMACDGGVKPGEFSSVTEHIGFLHAIIPYASKDHSARKLAEALDQLRTALGKYG